jgi:hypothetical protein
MPVCMLVYGWSVEKAKGGIALPVIFMFLQGIAQLFCFPALNTYCLDVNQKRSAETVGRFLSTLHVNDVLTNDKLAIIWCGTSLVLLEARLCSLRSNTLASVGFQVSEPEA